MAIRRPRQGEFEGGMNILLNIAQLKSMSGCRKFYNRNNMPVVCLLLQTRLIRQYIVLLRGNNRYTKTTLALFLFVVENIHTF